MARDSSTFVVISPNGKRLLTLFFALFLIVLYLPTVLLIVFSFNDSTVAAFPLDGHARQQDQYGERHSDYDMGDHHATQAEADRSRAALKQNQQGDGEHHGRYHEW